MKKGVKRGFTLIEILVVIAITGIIGGFAIPRYSDSIRIRELESEALMLVKTLEMARKNAMSGDLGGCDSLLLYRVSIGDSSYEISALCDPDGEGQSNTTIIDSKKKITLSTSSDTDVLFAALTGMTTGGNCITLTDTKTSRCYSISIGNSGVIETHENTCTCPE